MPYQPHPLPHMQLTWGDNENAEDFRRASPGQLFIGVIDTQGHFVYLLPSELEPDDIYQNDLRMLGKHISRPRLGTPIGGGAI